LVAFACTIHLLTIIVNCEFNPNSPSGQKSFTV
jgi:hypothetical protein